MIEWVLAIVLLDHIVAGQPASQLDGSVITRVTNLRLRDAPSTSGSVTIELPLGTPLVVTDRTTGADPWYHVQTDDGRNGWILGRLTRRFDRKQPLPAIESIVVERFTSGPAVHNWTFPAEQQLLELVERAAAQVTDREAEGRLAWYRLRAMQRVLGSIPFGRANQDPYRAWIRGHEDAARYNEPGGQWMVNPAYVLEQHARYRDTAAADEIAWLYVQNGFYGECEGDVPCYVDWTNSLDGEYLRLHPRGRHAHEAAAEIGVKLNGIIDNLQDFPAVLKEFDGATRCAELNKNLDALVTAVAASAARDNADPLKAADRFAQLCR